MDWGTWSCTLSVGIKRILIHCIDLQMLDKPGSKEDFVTENADEIGSLWFQLFRWVQILFINTEI